VSTGSVIDVLSPSTIEDIEARVPASDHTGNKHRLIQGVVMDPMVGVTTSARRAFSEPVNLAVREAKSRTSTFGDETTLFWMPMDRTRAEEMPGYGPNAVVVFLVDAAKSPFQAALKARFQALRRDIRNRLAHGRTEYIEDLLTEAYGITFEWPESTAVERPRAQAARAEPSATTDETTVAELATEMRGMADLPVQDVARMCGVQRRQFYNLMNGTNQPANAGQEQRFRQVHRILGELFNDLDQRPEAVRAALLTPLGDGLSTLYDVARAGDPGHLGASYKQLREQFAAARPDRSALPPSGTLPADAEQWQLADQLVGSRGTQELRDEDGSE
jgi:hypothetical protein